MPAAVLSDTQILAWARLARMSRAVLDRIENDLKAARLPPLAWYDALLELKRAGRPGLRPFELQHAMLLAQYGVSRLADRLVKAGYVERFECPEDGRGQVLRLTADGHALLKKMWPAYRAAIVAHFAGKLTCADAESLAAILAKLN
jgi:DNA-binding MarR family transcriptional regulator